MIRSLKKKKKENPIWCDLLWGKTTNPNVNYDLIFEHLKH